MMPGVAVRQRLAAELRRLARVLARWAEGLERTAPGRPVTASGPPDHWVEMVRARAPGLLRGDGVGVGPDGPRARPVPSGSRVARRPHLVGWPVPTAFRSPTRRARRRARRVRSAGSTPPVTGWPRERDGEGAPAPDASAPSPAGRMQPAPAPTSSGHLPSVAGSPPAPPMPTTSADRRRSHRPPEPSTTSSRWSRRARWRIRLGRRAAARHVGPPESASAHAPPAPAAPPPPRWTPRRAAGGPVAADPTAPRRSAATGHRVPTALEAQGRWPDLPDDLDVDLVATGVIAVDADRARRLDHEQRGR